MAPILILTFAIFIFQVPFRGSFMLFIFEVIIFITTVLSLGIFISSIAKTQQIALMASLVGLMMPTIMLSGFIYPIENMPALLQYLSYVIPARWFLIILRSIMLKGLGIEHFWKETLVLVFMTFILITVSMKNFKTRLE